jgi:hypothetical protein
MAPVFRVTIPEGWEPVYRWAAPAFLVLAVVSFGWWLRVRSARTGRTRAFLWLAAGSLVIAFSAGWLWLNRDEVKVDAGLVSLTAVFMPWCWWFAALAVIVTCWQRVRGGGRATPVEPPKG